MLASELIAALQDKINYAGDMHVVLAMVPDLDDIVDIDHTFDFGRDQHVIVLAATKFHS